MPDNVIQFIPRPNPNRREIREIERVGSRVYAARELAKLGVLVSV